jgi:Tfp pilus assembly protein PilX
VRALHRVRWRRADRGNALLIAVMVTSVCLGLALVGVQLAVSATRSSGVDRQRVLAANAAEAGVDSAYTAIQAAGVNLPCAMASGDVRSAPDTASYNTTVTYYDAAGAVLACPLVAGAVPAQALIRSTATTNALAGAGSKPTRKFEALINLTAQGGGAGGGAAVIDQTIFADGDLSTSSNFHTMGNSGANANLYSNGNVVCNSSTNIAGSAYSQGDFSSLLACTLAGNVWAKGNVSLGSNVSIGGFVKAGTGTIAANLLGTAITGNLYAGSTIGYPGCATAGKCFPNSSPGSPPAAVFPQIPSDDASLAKWTAAGYTVYDDNASCNTIGARIISTYATKTTKTLLRTTCAVVFAFSTTTTLSSDLAIFAKGGISFNSSDTFTSTPAGTRRNMYWIVPYDAATLGTPCTTPSITGQSSLVINSAVWAFIYSPCDINFSSSNTIAGQIYGGSKVTLQSAFTLNYQNVPVYGITATTAPAAGYLTSVVYKRESR